MNLELDSSVLQRHQGLEGCLYAMIYFRASTIEYLLCKTSRHGQPSNSRMAVFMAKHDQRDLKVGKPVEKNLFKNLSAQSDL